MLTPLKAIRAYCLDCTLGSYTETKLCPSTSCACWPYRLGHNPKQATTGLTATYTVDATMTARKAVYARCADCNAEHRRDCGHTDCALYPVRYQAVLAAKNPSTRPPQRATASTKDNTRPVGVTA